MKGLIFTYLMAYGGAVIALVDPFIGLLIYVGFGLLRPEVLWFWSVEPGNYSRIIAICLLIGWAARGFGKWQFGNARIVVAFMLTFWGWSVISAISAPVQQVAWYHVEKFSKILLPVLVGATLIDSVAKLKQLAWVITLSVGYLAYRENEIYYAGGIEEFDNFTAHTMTVGAGVAFFLGMQTQSWWKKPAAFACAAVMVNAVFFHMSRGAMVGLVGMGFVCFLALPKKPLYLLFYAVAIIVGLQLAGPSVWTEFRSIFSTDPKDGGRQQLWKDMLDAAQRSPIVGLGPGHWPLTAHRYGWPPGKQGHGLWPQIAAELGLIGGTAYLLFFVSPIFLLWRHAHRSDPSHDPALSWTARMAVAALSGFVLEAQFGSFSLMEVSYYAVLLAIGALALISRATVENRALRMPEFVEPAWPTMRRERFEVQPQ